MPENNERERRIYTFNVEARAADADNPQKIMGYASVFNREADLGWFIETVLPGAFTKTIVEDDIRALFNHDSNQVLGRNKAGTLTLREDPTGLFMEITPGTRSYEVDLLQSIQRGEVTQASFGFMVRARNIREVGDKYYRDLVDVQLFDVSPVTFPAYESTSVWMRSLEGIRSKEFPARPGDQQPVDWRIDLDRRQKMLEIVR